MKAAVMFLWTGVCALCQAQSHIAGCDVFPADNIWNVPVDTLPVHARSADYVNSVGTSRPLHPDFGSNFGIPFAIVRGDQPTSAVRFDYGDESDPGPYPIPPNPPVEDGGDAHLLMVDQDHCVLYELFDLRRSGSGGWAAGSGAVFDLKSYALRPATWTSADAAGLPVLPGLVRYDEVAAGEIRHAIRLTVPQTQAAYVWPARHQASSITNLSYPPMGTRFRLRADFDISGFSQPVQVILRALKKYGMILADNGSSWYLTGVPDSRWNDDTMVTELRRVTGAVFEAVDSTALMANADSARIRAPEVVNAASYRPGAVVPGELISIFATGLGPAQAVPLQLVGDTVSNQLGGTQVLFDGKAAPLLWVQEKQVNAVVPYSVRTSTAISVQYQGATVFSASAAVQTGAPGILTRDASGGGTGAILNHDYTPNSPAHPAARGEWISIYATGGGATTPLGVDGKLGGVQPPTVALARVSVRIGGAVAELNYAGGSQFLVAGVLQVNARVPLSVAPGDAVPVVLTIDGVNSQGGVTMAVR